MFSDKEPIEWGIKDMSAINDIDEIKQNKELAFQYMLPEVLYIFI